MKKLILIILVVSIAFSCADKKSKFKEIEFTNNYHFNSEILNNIKLDTFGEDLEGFATNFSIKSEFVKAQEIFDSISELKKETITQKSIDSLNVLYNKISANSYIIDKSRENSIIIINEAHHVPYHRTFTKSLLRDLYKNGYRHLGMEALNSFDTLIQQRGYPIQSSGFYTREPEFGNMIRQAIDIGYNIFGYEDWEEARKGAEFREIAQATNIKKVVDAHPNEKILIHCGYQHASEGMNHPYWKKAMAQRLSEMTGINPLTIDQTKYAETSNEKTNNIFLQSFDFKMPTVLIDTNKVPLSYIQSDEKMDLAIFHPITQSNSSVPRWQLDSLKKVEIELSDLTITYPIMVLAFDVNDDISTATPVSIIEIEKKPTLMLRLEKGNYQIVITNGEKSFALSKNVK